MTITTISSATKEVKIGFNQPFVIIGERINPTGKKGYSEELRQGKTAYIRREAQEQTAAGASGWQSPAAPACPARAPAVARR